MGRGGETMNPRLRSLLLKAAADMKRGVPPLQHEFLVNNNVTIYEANDLCDLLAAAIGGFAKAPVKVQAQIIVASASSSRKQAEAVISHADNTDALGKCLDKLKSL
jgi:hypothetical protein